MSIFPEVNRCSKPALNIAFRGRNRVARLYLKIMYRAVYLDKIFKKSRSLLIIDDIYIIVLACLAGGARRGAFGLRSEASPKLVSAPESSTVGAPMPFSTASETRVRLRRQSTAWKRK